MDPRRLKQNLMKATIRAVRSEMKRRAPQANLYEIYQHASGYRDWQERELLKKAVEMLEEMLAKL